MYPTERTELLKHISVQWYNKKGESPKTVQQGKMEIECDVSLQSINANDLIAKLSWILENLVIILFDNY